MVAHMRARVKAQVTRAAITGALAAHVTMGATSKRGGEDGGSKTEREEALRRAGVLGCYWQWE